MTGEIKSYRDLKVWQKSIDLVKEVYALTRKFPKQETFGLTNQIQRSAISIPSNIAEGQARQHASEFRQFLYIALGSAAELDTQMVIAYELQYMTEPQMRDIEMRIIEIRKMIFGLLARLPH